MFEKDHLERWLESISAHIPESIVIYLIGGCALSFKGLKERTKDIDIITISKREFSILDAAMVKAGFRRETDLKDEFYLTALAVYKKEESRIDVFLNKVGQMLSFTSGMKKRSTLHNRYGKLKVYLASNEDIFLFKAMTPRAGDIFDCTMLMTQELDYTIIYREALEQSKAENKWFFWVYEKVCAIEDHNGMVIPIKSKLWELVKSHWKERPADFMSDSAQIEKHIPNQKLLKEVRK